MVGNQPCELACPFFYSPLPIINIKAAQLSSVTVLDSFLETLLDSTGLWRMQTKGGAYEI
jgi:hypothetical protein